MQLYRIDLNLDSLLRRTYQRFKPYTLNDPQQTTEQDDCEKHLSESWKDQRSAPRSNAWILDRETVTRFQRDIC
ncbi:MAG: hypothetical protein LH702_34940 [Phormidesmis sp. CAN_BIN44]|nr:hypothetical protein [Phormidesmis sp. CAN_BIN44]